jgi:hypothetical protein
MLFNRGIDTVKITALSETGIRKSKVVNQMMEQIVSITGDRKINLK